MIGIGGLARAGKDTLALNLADIIKEDLGVEVEIFSFARAIKQNLDPFLTENLGISAFTDNTFEKSIIRPIMVSYGEAMKNKHGKNIWADIVFKEIKDSGKFPIIPDVRFPFEVNSIKENNGQVIHISRQGNELPPNETEAKNDPLVSKSADLCHSWPNYGLSKLHECSSHAQILWQMLCETHKEQWKTIYS